MKRIFDKEVAGGFSQKNKEWVKAWCPLCKEYNDTINNHKCPKCEKQLHAEWQTAQPEDIEECEGVIIPPKSSRKVVCMDNQQFDKLKQRNAELEERNNWFDNLVEYKVKDKYASLKDYVESLEQRIVELEKALNGLMNEVFSGQASMSSYGYKQSQQALSKEKE